MKFTDLGKNFLIPIALLGLASTPLIAASKNSKNGNVATIQSYGNSVYWSINPGINFDSITVNLSARADKLSRGGKLSAKGSNVSSQSEPLPSIVTDIEPSTGALQDGSYKYEIIVTPSIGPSVRAELIAARAAADGQEATAAVKALKKQGKIPQQRQVQFGHFRILNGQMVSDDDARE